MLGKFKQNHVKGFTMIELVMVIVIIGILAAAALPRFANLSTQAQVAANQGVAGALRAAVGVAHAAWIAAGASSSTSTITLDGSGVEVNASGWVDGGASSITTMTAAQCVTALTAVLTGAPQTVTSGCTDTPCYLATASSAVCTYTLYSGTSAVSPARTITYNIASGAVTAT